MPNWCNNVLEISHEGPIRSAELRRIVQDIQNAKNFSGPFLQALIPCPYDEFEALDRLNDYPEKFKEYQKSLIEQYGTTEWYSWCTSNWGTKWDVNIFSVEEKGNGFHLSFDSAWAPPIEAYQTLSQQGYNIQAYYHEAGMAYCGKWDSLEGDLYVEYTADTLDDIPNDIDEVFAIREWVLECKEFEETLGQESNSA